MINVGVIVCWYDGRKYWGSACVLCLRIFLIPLKVDYQKAAPKAFYIHDQSGSGRQERITDIKLQIGSFLCNMGNWLHNTYTYIMRIECVLILAWLC